MIMATPHLQLTHLPTHTIEIFMTYLIMYNIIGNKIRRCLLFTFLLLMCGRQNISYHLICHKTIEIDMEKCNRND